MINKKFLIRLFLAAMYVLALYFCVKYVMFKLVEEVEVEHVTHNNPPVGIVRAVNTSIGTFRLTGYCPCMYCCGKTDGITSTGTKAVAGRTIAVDPTIIPYGSTVVINGKEYIAEDCGGAIKNNKIDIFFDTHEEALEWGVKYAEVFIKKVGG